MNDVIFSSTATLTLVTVVGALLTTTIVGVIVRRLLVNRPATRTTAAQRLLAKNPSLGGGDVASLRWSVAARRVRTGSLTALTVAVALLIASARPTIGRPTANR